MTSAPRAETAAWARLGRRILQTAMSRPRRLNAAISRSIKVSVRAGNVPTIYTIFAEAMSVIFVRSSNSILRLDTNSRGVVDSVQEYRDPVCGEIGRAHV